MADPSDRGVWRILDANANRAAEGLRVVEDYLRFIRHSPGLTERCKQLRHELAAVVGRLSLTERLRARDAASDLGPTLNVESEQIRHDPTAVAAASLARAQQALRGLEEYAKVVHGESAAAFEQLRYQVYGLEQAAFAAAATRQRLEASTIYALVDGGGSLAEFRETVARLVDAGVDAIQLRDKELDDRALYERGLALRELLGETGPLLVMNDRPDVALLVEADALHLGQEDLPLAAARRIVGGDLLIGVSTHSLTQAKAAVQAGADYLGVGPTFPSRTKAFANFAGLDFVRQVAGEIRVPAFAIGGIDADNAAQVAAAGLRRVAVSACLRGDPLGTVRRLRAALDHSTPS